MKRIVAVALLLSGAAIGQVFDRTCRSADWRTTAYCSVDPVPAEPIFEFADPNGVGLPNIVSLCTSVDAGDLTGAWVCQLGDGGVHSGSVSLTAVGGPQTLSQSICPNGPNCNPVASQYHSGSTVYHTPTTSTGYDDDLSVCVVVQQYSATTNILASHNAGSANGWYFYLDGSGKPTFNTGNGATSAAVAASTGVVLRSWNHVCVVYDEIADGTSVGTLYTNGVNVGTSSVLKAINGPNVNLAIVGNDGTSPAASVGVREALVTATKLSDTEIARMARATMADRPASTGGVEMTFTRAGASGCQNADGGLITILPNDRPCIRSGGFGNRPAVTNRSIRSEELDNAAWTVNNVTKGAADSYFAPDGTKTAEDVTTTVAGGFLEGTGFVGSGGRINGAIWVRACSGTISPTIEVYSVTAAAVRCTATASSIGTDWYYLDSCSGSTTGTNTHTLRLYPNGTAGSGCAVFWGGMGWSAQYGTPYSRTEGASVASVIEHNSFDFPADLSDSVGCFATRLQTYNQRQSTDFWFTKDLSSSIGLMFNDNSSLRVTDTSSQTVVLSFSASTLGHTLDIQGRWKDATITLYGCDRDTAECVSASGAFDGFGFSTGVLLRLGYSEVAGGVFQTAGPQSFLKFGNTMNACGWIPQ